MTTIPRFTPEQAKVLQDTAKQLMDTGEIMPVALDGRVSTRRAFLTATRGATFKISAWSNVQPVGVFLDEVEQEFKGIARDLLAPESMSIIVAPKGLGKTHVGLSLAVTLATGGEFRGEKGDPLRVLYVDRDNPSYVLRERLERWGGRSAHGNLDVLTRKDAPPLNKADWRAFPTGYDVVMIDSIGASTEGITEAEGRQTTEILAMLLDLAASGPAVLLQGNTTKDGTKFKGRGEWEDRATFFYEAREVTEIVPANSEVWWMGLPEAGAGNFADRAARRRGREIFRLAFIPTKTRSGMEIDPFCLELRLYKDKPWELVDVTEAMTGIAAEKIAANLARTQEIAKDMYDRIANRYRDQDFMPLMKAYEILQNTHHLSKHAAEQFIRDYTGTSWEEIAINGKSKGLVPKDPPA